MSALLDKVIREQVWQRSKGYCEMCGISMDKQDFAIHHRKLKSRGGKDTMSNLIAVHHGCHNLRTDSIHLNPIKLF
jgi:5-methylcytosine-specific restriction endonuclease McrA